MSIFEYNEEKHTSYQIFKAGCTLSTPRDTKEKDTKCYY